MKTLLTILLFISTNSFSQLIHINGAGAPISINEGTSAIAINPFFRQVKAIDNGYYDGFPMIADVEGKETWGVYKFSSSHGGGGPLMLIHTTNWGQTWKEDSITVDEDVIYSTNHSFAKLSTGRMLITYRVSGVIYFAYNDNNDSAFYSTGTPISPATDYGIAQSPIKMVETSYGTVIFAYYQVGSNGNPNSAILMESEDYGLTWSQKAVVYTSNNVYPTGAPSCRGTEIAICETHPTGIEATSKWIAVVRTEVADGGAYPMKFNSSDGGNTWSQDLTTDAGSFVNDLGATVSSGGFSRGVLYLFLETNSPFDIVLQNGTIYISNGERNTTYGYSLKFATATPDNAFRNQIGDWERPTFIKFYNAKTLGSSTDCGYPVFFRSGNDLFVAEYDVSTEAPLPGVTRRVFVETVKIPTLPL